MKYLCFDGIDRDEAIGRYLALEDEIIALRKVKKEIEWKYATAIRKSCEISFNELGAAGRLAIDAVRGPKK